MSSAPLFFLYLVKIDLPVGKHRYKLDHALDTAVSARQKVKYLLM